MRLIAFLILAMLPHICLAQSAATLIADTVRLTDDQQLIAAGNIEVLYDGTRLTATQITYDRDQDQLTIVGPIVTCVPGKRVCTASANTCAQS